MVVLYFLSNTGRRTLTRSFEEALANYLDTKPTSRTIEAVIKHPQFTIGKVLKYIVRLNPLPTTIEPYDVRDTNEISDRTEGDRLVRKIFHLFREVGSQGEIAFRDATRECYAFSYRCQLKDFESRTAQNTIEHSGIPLLLKAICAALPYEEQLKALTEVARVSRKTMETNSNYCHMPFITSLEELLVLSNEHVPADSPLVELANIFPHIAHLDDFYREMRENKDVDYYGAIASIFQIVGQAHIAKGEVKTRR